MVNLDIDKNIILKRFLGEYGVDSTQNGSEEAPAVNFIECDNKSSVMDEYEVSSSRARRRVVL